MSLLDVARTVEPLLRSQGRLIRLGRDVPTTYVGDVHGDLDAVERVLSLAPAADGALVFLGDVVDRGPASRECLERVLGAKLASPKSIHLLMGNHEAWGQARFCPADFWESLTNAEAATLAAVLLQLPFAAWHGAG